MVACPGRDLGAVAAAVAPQPQDTATIVAIVLVVAAVCARYWRTVLLMIMISLLIFTVLGLIVGLHDMQHLVR